MTQITGCGRSQAKAEGDVVRTNQLNHFYNQLDGSAVNASAVLSTSFLTFPSPTVGARMGYYYFWTMNLGGVYFSIICVPEWVHFTSCLLLLFPHNE